MELWLKKERACLRQKKHMLAQDLNPGLVGDSQIVLIDGIDADLKEQ